MLDPTPHGERGLTRRRLLRSGGAAAAALALRPVTAAAAGLEGLAVPAYLRRSTYVALVGQRFVLGSPAGRIQATLAGVEDLGVGRPMQALAGRDDAFALVFAAAARDRLGQAVMSVEHPALGRADLLVSPSSTGRGARQSYTAVINRAPSPRR